MSNSASTIGLPVLRVSRSASSSARERDDLRQLEQHPAAVLRGRVLPRPLVERVARGSNRPIHVGRAGVRHARHDVGGRRIDDVEGGRPLGRDEFAVDVEGIGFHEGLQACHERQTTTILSCRNRCKVCRMTTMKRAIAAGVAIVAFSTAIGAQDAHPTFTVGTATAQRGHKAYGVLKVPAGKDAGYDIPVVVLHGARPGPVLAVASGAHGTEYASIIAVERLIDAVDPAQLSGTLILLPLINVPSFERIVPHVNPTDNKSMNRFYPGDPNGTQTDRASFVITKEVVDSAIT